MIKPATLWGLFKTCDDSKWLGDICRALGGQSVPIDYGQRQMVKSIQLDSGWLDEAVEARRSKWRDQKRGQRGQYKTTRTNEDNAELSNVRECPPPSILPSVLPSSLPNKTNTIRSVTVTVAPNGNANGNGTGLAGEVERFAKALSASESDGEVFFSPDWDPAVIAVYVTGDARSVRRWRDAMKKVGEDVMREELFTFYREIRAGEDVDNRGAALNARLKKLEAGK